MKYDLIIIGAGPAGLTAAIYAARYKLNVIIISKDMGGMAATAHKICNFPSQKQIKGFELMRLMSEQVKDLNVPIIYDSVTKIDKLNNKFVVYCGNKKYESKKVIYAGGTIRKRLNIDNEDEFVGKGISYCATCDAAFFKKKCVAVVGGSDAALTAALLLREFDSKVYLIYRGEKFERPDPTWVELIGKDKEIKVLFKEEIVSIFGTNKVEGVKLKSGKELKVDGIFVEIGSSPDVNFLLTMNVEKNDKGYIITDKAQKTNIPGFFASGDITNNILKQIVTATSEGATAAYSAYKEIKQEENEK